MIELDLDAPAPSGHVKVVCNGCGKIFAARITRVQAAKRGGQARMFCTKACSDRHLPVQQVPPEVLSAVRQDMAAGRSWYECSRERGLPRTTVRNLYRKMAAPERFERSSPASKAGVLTD